MKIIKSKNATIEIGAIENSSFPNLVNSYQQVIILVDENTKILLPTITTHILKKEFQIIEIKSGEEHKNITTSIFIWEQLSTLNFSRNSLFINLGGGVITDLGGFSASCFKRGIDFVNIPTTLLSLVDASVGGKTGVNFNHLKNNIGLFKEARTVFCDISLIKTLPHRELIGGIGEVLKHALIVDYSYWKYCKETAVTDWDWEYIVTKSIEIKNTIVLEDPLEKGERKKLNFGHTIGHAIESLSLDNNIKLLHGEAVAIGLICETHLSRSKNLVSEQELNEITNLILTIFILPKITFTHNAIIDLMAFDKKNNSSEINFTLIQNIGSSLINQTASDTEIRNSINYYNQSRSSHNL